MPERKKLCVLGGSAFGTPLLFESMADLEARQPYDVVLYGRNETRLKQIAAISRQVIENHTNLDLSVSTTIDIEEAVENADLVLNQIRVGGLKARLFDETFPRKFGIPGEETVGPGGFSNAFRQIPVVLDLCRIIEKLAPDAVLLNLTNPSSIIHYAIEHFTDVKVLGTCNSPVDTINGVAAVFGDDQHRISFEWFGMHHFGWLFDVLSDGASVMDEVLENIDHITNIGVDPEIIRAMGAIPVSYFKYYFHPDRILAATEGRTPRAAQLIGLYQQIESALMAWKAGDPLDLLKKRRAGWYKKIVVPTLLALAEKQSTELILSVTNSHDVSWLPPEAIIEAPVKIKKGIVEGPRIPNNIPADIQGMITRNCAYEMLAAEAIVEKNRDKAIRALQSNLLVQNFNQVRGILADVWPNERTRTYSVESAKKIAKGEEKKQSLGFEIPMLYYGKQAIEAIDLLEKKFGVFSMEVPWSLVKERMPRAPEFTVFIEELDWYMLEEMERSLPSVDAIIGIGGGMATDAAKYLAWKRGIPADVIPTITSVDASVTKSIAARAGGHVTYIGYIVPRNVYIDYTVIGGAPKRLNRSGVGDILCAHTALFDWRLSHLHTGEVYEVEAVEKMHDWLKRMEAGANDIRKMTDNGIKLIMRAFEDISIICRKFGSSRPQEGADHTFAYNAEFLTGKSFLHGELVALGTYVIAHLQKNDPGSLLDIYERTGILWQPKDIGLSEKKFVKTLKTLNWYQKNFGRRYTILDEKTISSEFIKKMVKELEF